MDNPDDSRTRVSLLLAIQAGGNVDAWDLFCRKYGPRILGWCRKWGASPQDAEDILQETLVVVYRRMVDFQYNPSLSFRAWLKTVARHLHRDIDEKTGNFLPRPAIAGTVRAVDAAGHSEAPAIDEYRSLLDQIADEELFALALERVRAKTPPRVWQCYERSVLLHLSGKDVANQLHITEGYARLNVHRVKKLIEKELESLDPPTPWNPGHPPG